VSVCVCVCTHTYTYAHTHIHTKTHTQTHKHTLSHTHTHTHTNTHTHTHIHPPEHTHTHTHTQTSNRFELLRIKLPKKKRSSENTENRPQIDCNRSFFLKQRNINLSLSHIPGDPISKCYSQTLLSKPQKHLPNNQKTTCSGTTATQVDSTYPLTQPRIDLFPKEVFCGKKLASGQRSV